MGMTQTHTHLGPSERNVADPNPPWVNLVTALLGLWLVSAVYADGWAHLNVASLESFFTPWHGALYAGLTVFAAWTAVVVWRARRGSGSWLDAVPVGYRGAAVGVALFAVGGAADLVWHQIFGVEAGIDALVSPSHLVLLAGGSLMVATSWRAERARAERATISEVLSLATAAALAAFFLSYTSAFAQATPTTPFSDIPPEGAPGHMEAELPVIAALAAYLVSTAVIVVPLVASMTAHRRHPATLTVVTVLVAGLTAAMVDLPGVAVAGAIGAGAGALIGDAAMARWRPEGRASRYAVPVWAAVVTLLVWSGQMIGFALFDAVRWPVTLWSGVVVLAGLAAAALALPFVAARSRTASA